MPSTDRFTSFAGRHPRTLLTLLVAPHVDSTIVGDSQSQGAAGTTPETGS